MPTPKNKTDLSYALNLPPEKAIEYFKAKGHTFSWDWKDTWKEAHAKAFTVAKVMRMDILEDIRGMCQKSLDEGITFKQFRKELEPKLKAKGWWGKTWVGDGKEAKQVQLGSPYRLKNIYRTNLQTSYMAGRYKSQIENAENRPYWQWVAILDGATRASHAKLNKKVFRYADPFWNTFYPPIDWGCRCEVRTYDKEDLNEKNLSPISSKGLLTTEKMPISSKGETATVSVINIPGKGFVKTGAGWDYNPGKEAWQPDLDKYSYNVAKDYIQGAVTGPDFKRFFSGEIAGKYPVAVLDDKYRKQIKAKTQTVYMSDESLKKNIAHHPELTMTEYQKLPELLSSSQIIIEKKEQFLIFIKKDNKFYFSVVKTTRAKDELYLTSFRQAHIKSIEKELKQGKILKNELIK